jgi:hypothetical protein
VPQVLPKIARVKRLSLLEVADFDDDHPSLWIDTDRKRLPSSEPLNNGLVANTLGRMIGGGGGAMTLSLRPFDDSGHYVGLARPSYETSLFD